MSLVRSKPLPVQAAALIELRFLVPPAMVETARQAMAPYARASVLPEGPHAQPGQSAMPVAGMPFTGITRKELEALLRD